MAVIQRQAKRPPSYINKFLGLNQNTTGDTQIGLGESPDMLNFRITENYKLRKREGYKALFETIGAENRIQAIWTGSIGGSERFVFACAGKLWEHDLALGTNTEIGTIADAHTCLFAFSGILYILDGTDYKKWDGTTLSSVSGYRPLIAVSTKPAGGGTDLESINLLTGQKRQWFDADGTSTIYQLQESAITSVDWVKKNGVTLTLTTDYTVNLTNGTVTPVSAASWPTGTPNNIEVGWTKGTGDRNLVARMQYTIGFGPANDTRLFSWGDPQNSDTVRYTGLADGLPSAEYWPALAELNVGVGQFAVTDLVRQQDRLNIYTNAEDAWYCTSDVMTDALGRSVAIFPTYPLHGSIGSVTPGQAQLLNNNPVTISESGVYSWQLAGIKDERNAVLISKQIQPSIDAVQTNAAVTIDYDTLGEYWMCVEGNVWIYNYRLGCWYFFNNIPATVFCVLDKKLYFGTDSGQIMVFDESLYSDMGDPIKCHWEMGFYDFNQETLMKFVSRLWLSMQPEPRARVDISYTTNRGTSAQVSTAKYALATFEHANFGSWSFLTSYNPQPFRFKIKAKKFVYFKIMLDSNNVDEGCTILSLNFKNISGGESK